ncbi:MAG TPA: thioredoxin domain-containing protein, partial [Candidatus Nanoarchaeia archaeon]|nr:thioredoxin domain-containing protein [Candidatus Nanoarchaeia archaeon]
MTYFEEKDLETEEQGQKEEAKNLEKLKKEPQVHKLDEHKNSDQPRLHSEIKKEEKSLAHGKLNNFQKFLAVAVIIQIALLLFIAVKLPSGNGVTDELNGADGNAPAKAAPAAPAEPSAVASNAELADDDAVKGKEDAPVTIVEFSDYECPFCARFYTDTFGQLKAKYIDTGKVKFVYRDFPLSFHQNAQKAAEAAECAGEQNKYYEMHNKLFEGGVQGGTAAFKGYAQEIGLDTSKFNSC